MSIQELVSSVNWDKGNGLVPAIVQDAESGDVLMLAYMNAESLEQSYESNLVTFYSRSKQALWIKGETSGNFLDIVSISLDCDQDTFLIKANPRGPACHTGDETCFGERTGFKAKSDISFLLELQKVIQSRKEEPSTGGYTSSLFDSGINRIAQKVGEEGVETVIAALKEDDVSLIGEASDLIYHLIVLLTERDLSLDAVMTELKSRSH